ncbi:DUF4192 family protein [Arthrobacter sp. EPSL27]|uniref:DUF4192 family protein n=1 Tax=Arthrobacter sp. EPSL27 TaxID=1745378 RepID=UPI000748A23B|nr:DUF4192 family protein [Arthrobacter sp. EPSL27]KUM37595.1 hypothetical protein AR539_10160 [Arthrobacter sp. EPSL27]
MTASDHLKITGPEDILGFIPHSLGYWPAGSLVAMTMQGTRLGATLRVDLPDPAAATRSGPAGPAAFARSVASYLAADHEADGSLLAFFTEAGTDNAPWARHLAELERALDHAGMPVRDAWLVGSDHWRNAYCTDPSCCAPPGRPVDEIRNSRLNAEMVFRGSAVGAAPGALELSRPEPADPAVLEAQRDWEQQFALHSRDAAQFRQVLEVWSRVLDVAAPLPTLPAALAAYLRASLCVLPWRDAVLVMTAAGPEAAERGAAEFGVFDAGVPEGAAGSGRSVALPGPVPGAFPPTPLPPLDGFPPPQVRPRRAAHTVAGYGEVLLGLAPPVPDWGRMASLERILEQIGVAGGEAGAAALTGRGWIEWCRGKGSFAHALFSRADEEHPGYRLAELLDELAGRGTLCGWAARKETAWQRFEPDVA